MPLSFRVFQIILSVVLVNAGEIVPDACSATQIVCVSEGNACYADYRTKSRCSSTAMSRCLVCGSPDMTCHAGYCIKHIGAIGQACTAAGDGMTADHIACKAGLECIGNICKSVPISTYTELSRGESCNFKDDHCTQHLMCDITNKCAWPVCRINTNPPCTGQVTKETCEAKNCFWEGANTNFKPGNSARLYVCDGPKDCHFGEYCDTQNRVCLPSIPIGQRLGATCVSQDGVGDEQCGWGMICVPKNALETDPGYQILVCKWITGPFEAQEGERCQKSNDCGRSMLCSKTTCMKPNYAHLGEGCDRDTECGRGLECACPLYGDASGGRKRCIIKEAYINHDKDMDTHKQYLKLYNCANTNKCKLETGACMAKNCQQFIDNMESPVEDICNPSLSKEGAYIALKISGSIRCITLLTWNIVIIFVCLAF